MLITTLIATLIATLPPTLLPALRVQLLPVGFPYISLWYVGVIFYIIFQANYPVQHKKQLI
jgi:hypothetical protein